VANRPAPSEPSVQRQAPGRAVPAAVASSGVTGERPQPRSRQALAGAVANTAATNLATLEPPRQRVRLAAAPVAASVALPGPVQQPVRAAPAATVASAAANHLAALDPPRQRPRLGTGAAAVAISSGEQWNGRDVRWPRNAAASIASNTVVVPAPHRVSAVLPPATGLAPARWRVPRDPYAVGASAVVLPPTIHPVPGRLVVPPPLVGGSVLAFDPGRQYRATYIPQQAILAPPRGWVRDPFTVLRQPWRWGPDPLARLGPLFRGPPDPFLWVGLPPAHLALPVIQPLPVVVPVPVPAPVPIFAREVVLVPCLVAPPPLVPGLFPTGIPYAGPEVCLIRAPMMAPLGLPFPPGADPFMVQPFPPGAPPPGFPFPAQAGAFPPQPFLPGPSPVGLPFLAEAGAVMLQPFPPGAPPLGLPLYPPPPGAINSPFGEGFAPAPLQETPVRLLSQQRGDYPLENVLLSCDGYAAWTCDDAAGQPPAFAAGLGTPVADAPASYSPPPPAGSAAVPNNTEPDADGEGYALAHPLLLCEVEEAEVCDDDMATDLAAIALGFTISVMDGPDGFGIYLTYVDPAESDADGAEYALVHPLLLCGAEEAEICDDDMADELAAVALGFTIGVMDGPDGFGIYLTYADPAELVAAQVDLTE
jgi:hypothetical protein